MTEQERVPSGGSRVSAYAEAIRRAWPVRWWLRIGVLLVSIPLLALLAWLFAGQIQRDQEDARSTALRSARAVATRMRMLNAESLQLLDRARTLPAVRDFDGSRCDSLFTIIDFFPQYTELLLLDHSGARLCTTPVSDRTVVASEIETWLSGEAAAGRLRPRRALLRAFGGLWVTAVAVPVVRSDGGDGGMLVVVQQPDVISREALPAGTVVTVIDQNATILARTADPQKWEGRDASALPIARLALRSKDGRASAVGVDGVERQYGFTVIPELGWYVYVGIPTSTIMRDARASFIRGIAGGLVIIAFITIIALWMLRGVERPVNMLVRAAQGVARGDFEKVEISRSPRELVTLAATFNEMVERRSHAEQAMAESERNLKAISDRLLVVQEAERTRIARELHDDLGQSLTALKMDVVGLLDSVPATPNQKALRNRIVGTLDSTVDSVQRISAELRPSILDDLGLPAALEADAKVFEERTGIECDLSLPRVPLELDTGQTIAIYRIVQEAMTNVARHSNASRVEVRLRVHDRTVLLEIRDDGRGVTADQAADRSSLGLVGIRERAQLIGGDAHIEGIEGRGTIVSVRIPMST